MRTRLVLASAILALAGTAGSTANAAAAGALQEEKVDRLRAKVQELSAENLRLRAELEQMRAQLELLRVEAMKQQWTTGRRSSGTSWAAPRGPGPHAGAPRRPPYAHERSRPAVSGPGHRT